MRTVIVAAALLLVGCRSVVVETADPSLQVLNVERRAVLAGTESERLFSQCSRQAPKPQSFWTPSPDTIDSLEADFLSYFRSLRRQSHVPLIDYYRQYAGFVRDGQRLVYCSFLTLPKGMPETFYAQIKSRAMVMCDGGDLFFGVVYDLDRRVFSEYRPNGGI